MRLKRKQQGSMLVISVFVILVMTFLGLAMTQLLSVSASSIVFEVGGLRALNAARSGLNQQLVTQFPISTEPLGSCNAPTNPVVFNNTVPGLAGCQYQISCSCTSHEFEGRFNNYFRISSTGSCAMAELTTSRTVAIESRVQLAPSALSGC